MKAQRPQGSKSYIYSAGNRVWLITISKYLSHGFTALIILFWLAVIYIFLCINKNRSILKNSLGSLYNVDAIVLTTSLAEKYMMNHPLMIFATNFLATPSTLISTYLEEISMLMYWWWLWIGRVIVLNGLTLGKVSSSYLEQEKSRMWLVTW